MDINLFPDGPSEEYNSTEGGTTSYLNSLDEETKRQEQKVEQVVQAEETSPSPEQDPDRVAGSGAERDVAGAISSAISGDGSGMDNPISQFLENAAVSATDWIDNTFQGDQKTREEVASSRDEARSETAESEEKRLEEARGTAFGGVADAVVRGVPGAALGAAEKGLGALEVAGDTVKAATTEVVKRATLGNVVLGANEDGSQNPFSDNYDWATWNLGKDEIGAQTGVGKVAQGFVEFAALMGRTGGFNGGGTTLAGSAIKGGLAGLSADMLSAVSGEGNMSNMIGDAVPELKDTWLTALAIQKDDNVFEAAMKTGLEGFGIGVPVELAVGGFARGVRALASGKNADKAVEAVQSTMPETNRVFHATSLKAADFIRNKGFRQGDRYSNIMGEGVYFATDARYAKAYGNELLEGSTEGLNILDLQGKSVFEFADEVGIGRPAEFMDMEGNVYDTPEEIAEWNKLDPDDRMNSWSDEQRQALQDYAKANGIDGIKYDPIFDDKLTDSAGTEVVIFDPKKADQLIAPRSQLQLPPGLGPNMDAIAKQIIESGDVERFDRFSAIMDMESKGIPTTWDDAAATVPEYYVKGAREVADDFSITSYERIQDLQPGQKTTIDPFTGEEPVSGTLVNIDGQRLEGLEPDDVSDFISQNSDILSREDVYLGVSVDKNTGKQSIELSRLVEDPNEAQLLGKLFDQKAVYDIDADSIIPTGGADVLKDTKGQHLRSAYTTPSEVTVKPTRLVQYQQMEAKQALIRPANGGGGERLATNAQVKQIADARGDGAGKAIDDVLSTLKTDEKDLAREAKISVSTLRALTENDLKGFLDIEGNLNLDAISKTKYDGEEVLSREGAFQVRALMANTASAIYDAAFKVSKTAQEGIDSAMHVKQLKDNMKALLRLHKKTSNLIGTRLADYSVNIADLNFKMDADFMKPKDPNKLNTQLEIAEKELDDMVKGFESGDPKAIQKAQRTAAMLQLTGGDVTKMVDVAQNMGQLGKEAMLKLMYNSMLSSPATHLVNNMSNMFNMVYRPLTAAVGGNAKVRKAAIASYSSFFQTMPEAFDLMMRTWKTGVSNVGGSRDQVLNQTTRIQLNELARTASESNDIALKAGSWLMHTLHDLADFPLIDWPSRFLTTSDEFFKVMVTRMEYKRVSMEKAIDLAGSKGDNAVQEAFEKILKDEYSRNFTKSGGVLNKDLLTAAKDVTFQTDLAGPAAKFAGFLNDVPALRIFFPFVKTGHNVLVYTGTHVPLLNLALKESREVLLKDTAEGAIMRGRMAFGGMTILMAGMAAANGQITGNGPAGGARRKEWLKTNQPRSFKVGDRFISYERIEPFGQILAAVADLHYAHTSGELEEDKAKYLAGYLSYALATNLTDKSMFQGLEPLSQIINPGQGGGGSTERLNAFALQTANNFVPLSGARRALTNAMNPYMQEFASELDRVKFSATMGLAGERAKTYDWLTGEDITTSSGGMGNAILPFKSVKRGFDVVKDKLEDIEFDSSVISDEFGGVELTPEQKSSFQKLMSQTGIYERLKAWVTHPNFDKSVAEYQDKLGTDYRVKKQDQFFYREILRTIRAHKKIALNQLQAEYPELNAEIMFDKYAAQQARMPNGYQGLINFGQ